MAVAVVAAGGFVLSRIAEHKHLTMGMLRTVLPGGAVLKDNKNAAGH